MITEEELDRRQIMLDKKLSERVERRRKTWVLVYGMHLLKALLNRVMRKVKSLGVKFKILN